MPNLTEEQWEKVESVSTTQTPRQAFDTALAGVLNRGCLIESCDASRLTFAAQRSNFIDEFETMFVRWSSVTVTVEGPQAGPATARVALREIRGGYPDGVPIADHDLAVDVWGSFQSPDPIPALRSRTVNATPQRVLREAADAAAERGYGVRCDDRDGGVLTAYTRRDEHDHDRWHGFTLIALARPGARTEIRMIVVRGSYTISDAGRDSEEADALWRAISVRLDDAIE